MNEFNTKMVRFKINRFNADHGKGAYTQDFETEVTRGMTIIDGLLAIKKDSDGSLTFRTSCGHGICGSCAVQVNGMNKLACETLIEENLNSTGTIRIAPAGDRAVIKDLVTEDTVFWEKYGSVKPWITPKETQPEREHIISADEVSKLNNAERCISCGICYASCPVLLKDQSFLGPHALLKAFLKITDVRETTPSSHMDTADTVWSCTTCYQCNFHCPIELTPGNAGIDIRTALMDDYKIPQTLGRALESIYERNNPYEMLHEDRNLWMKDLEIPNALETPVDVCYLSCCSTCYDQNMQSVGKNMAAFAAAADLSMGVMGEEEKCCGSEVYRLGEMGLFEFMVEERSELLDSVKAPQFLCSSPHCFDIYKNQYPQIDKSVIHYAQLIDGLITQDKITFNQEVTQKATYHDPCYLGLQNGVFDEPRNILYHIPGLTFVEMAHHKENSICCGGGGGNIWNERPVDQRFSHLRVQEALDTGSDFLVTACPFCFSELDDAVKILNAGDRIQVVDLMTMVMMAIK